LLWLLVARTTAWSATATATATAAFTTASTRTRLVNGQWASAHLRTIQCFDSIVGLTIICHLNESKPSRPTCFTIANDRCPVYPTMLTEHLLKFLIINRERQVAYVYVHLT
jgi:hypothetical protein